MDRDTTKRYVLVFSSMLVMGLMYCYDNPSALKNQLQQHFHHLPKAQFEYLFNLTYSLYSVPNTILPLIGGVLIDRVGVHLMAVALAGLVLLGQLTIAVGCAAYDFDLILFGRILIGLGGETLSVAQTKFVVKWFNPSELAFIFGVVSSFTMLASVLNYKWSPWIADHYHVTTALWVGVMLTGVSFLASVVLCRLDMSSPTKPTPSTDRVSFRDIRQFSWIFWLVVFKCFLGGCIMPFNNTAVSVFLERDFFQEPPLPCQRCGEGEYKIFCDKISSHCPSVPPFAWPLPQLSKNCSIETAFDQYRCSKDPPYIDDDAINCDDKAWREGPFTQKYCKTKGDASERAASAMSISPLVQTLLGPVAGAFVDMIGMRPHVVFVSEAAVAVAHSLIGFSHVPVTTPLLLFGVSWSVVGAAMSSSIPCTFFRHILADLSCSRRADKSRGDCVRTPKHRRKHGVGGRSLPRVGHLCTCCVTNVVFAVVFIAMDAAGGYRLSRRAEKSDKLTDDASEPFLS
ncbi:hypothetical protein Ae201684_009840 [Aphanomyces euteiches]|uniref:Lysosomal dipeptide transporter MFSD1 n=1 Tax=Aphanomyces euteiches TaxID=100861 RepID=A0A6G0X0G4_9STRA|nr:hypothetical protein Ae201684_009840 [Aphanomyces euteiches]